MVYIGLNLKLNWPKKCFQVQFYMEKKSDQNWKLFVRIPFIVYMSI